MIRFNSGRISRANLSGLIATLMRHIKTLTMQVNCNLFQLMLIPLQVQPKCILSNCPIIVIALYLLDVIHPLFPTVERPQTSAVQRSIGEVVQSRRRPLLGPSPG